MTVNNKNVNKSQDLKYKLNLAIKALKFYADPETYHAISILGDNPCGDFCRDLSADHGHPDYDYIPGKRARACLTEIERRENGDRGTNVD